MSALLAPFYGWWDVWPALVGLTIWCGIVFWEAGKP